MRSYGDCDREYDTLRSSVSPRDATGSAADSPRNIRHRATLKIFRALSAFLFLRSNMMPERESGTLVLTLQLLQFREHFLDPCPAATVRNNRQTPFLSSTLAAGSAEQQAACPNAAARTLASIRTDR